MYKKITSSACAVILLASAAFSASPAFKEKYSGGSISDIKAGDTLEISIVDNRIKLANGKSMLANIPVGSVTELSYGQDVHRRVGTSIGLAAISFGAGALMMFSKSKKHFIGVTWDDEGKKGGIAIQADKNDYRGLLTALEGITGKKAVNSDSLTVKN